MKKNIQFIMCFELFLLNESHLSLETADNVEKIMDQYYNEITKCDNSVKNELKKDIKEICTINNDSHKEYVAREFAFAFLGFLFDTTSGVLYNMLTEYIYCDPNNTQPIDEHCDIDSSKLIASLVYSVIVGLFLTGNFIDFCIDKNIKKSIDFKINSQYRDIISSVNLPTMDAILLPFYNRVSDPHSKVEIGLFLTYEIATDALPVLIPKLNVVSTKDFLPNFTLNSAISLGIIICCSAVYGLFKKLNFAIQNCFSFQSRPSSYSVSSNISSENTIEEALL